VGSGDDGDGTVWTNHALFDTAILKSDTFNPVAAFYEHVFNLL